MIIERETVILDVDEARELLSLQNVGRLALCANDLPDIFPVNFITAGDDILIRTDAGVKTRLIAANPNVAFEVDDTDPDYAWSVVAKGVAEIVDQPPAVRSATSSPLWAWAPEPSEIFVRVHISDISGRRFNRRQ